MIITQLIEKNSSLELEEEFSNAMQAIKYLNQNSTDLIFLDIHMPDFTGFDFIQTLKNPPNVILTTSDKSFAIEAFEYECIVDYMVKPITQKRFDKAVQKAINAKPAQSTPAPANDPISEVNKTENDLYVNIDRRLIKIDLTSIYLIEAKGDYIQIKTFNKNYTVHSTLKIMRTLLLISMLMASSFVISQNFNYLGGYDELGVPDYLEPVNDEISASSMQLINDALPEGYPVPDYNPHYISAGYDTNIELTEDASVWVTFVKEGAGYKNVLGFYTYDVNDPG